MNRPRLFAILFFILIAAFSRLIPHPPNFTSINAAALFSAFHLANPIQSFCAIFLAMLLGDLAIGFHSTMPFVYLSFGIVVLMGYHLKNAKSIKQLPVYLLSSSLIFFIIANFGVWFMGSLYPKTLEGLHLCYLAALPFLLNQILGDLVFGALLFGCFVITEKHVPVIQRQTLG